MNTKYTEAPKTNTTQRSVINRYPAYSNDRQSIVVQTNFKNIKSISVKYFELAM